MYIRRAMHVFTLFCFKEKSSSRRSFPDAVAGRLNFSSHISVSFYNFWCGTRHIDGPKRSGKRRSTEWSKLSRVIAAWSDCSHAVEDKCIENLWKLATEFYISNLSSAPCPTAPHTFSRSFFHILVGTSSKPNITTLLNSATKMGTAQ